MGNYIFEHLKNRGGNDVKACDYCRIRRTVRKLLQESPFAEDDIICADILEKLDYY